MSNQEDSMLPDGHEVLPNQAFRFSRSHEFQISSTDESIEQDSELEAAEPKKLDLTKALSEMTGDELIAWGAKECAGALLGGLAGIAFDKLRNELGQRQKSLADLIDEQTGKIEKIFGRILEDHDREEIQAYANALGNTVNDYLDAPSQDRLAYITVTSQELLELCMQPRLRRALFKTYLLVVQYHLTAYGERAKQAGSWGYNAAGEKKNLKRAIHERIIPYVRTQALPEWVNYLTEPLSQVVNLGGAPSAGNGFKWVYCPTYRVVFKDLHERLKPLGVNTAEFNARYSPPARGFYRNHSQNLLLNKSWIIEHSPSVPTATRNAAEHGLLLEAIQFRDTDVEWIREIALNDTQAEVCISKWLAQFPAS